MHTIKAMAINESGLLTRTSIIKDRDLFYADYDGPRFRADPSQQEKLVGWGDMDGEVIALVDDIDADDLPPQYWISLEK